MYGLDLIVVGLWFLPVTLFVILPLTVTCLWGALSFFAGLFGHEETLSGVSPVAPEAAS